MAEAQIPVKYLDDVTACPICAEDYTDPRLLLPCVHTFCLQCISRWGQDLKPGDKFDCPLCRSEVQVPTAGFAGFHKNFFIDNLIEAKRRATKKKLCDVCVNSNNKSDDEKSATVYCVECEQSLCQQCAECHSMLKSSKAHKLVEMMKDKDGKEAAVQLVKLKDNLCEKHRDMHLEGYCFDCSLPVCMTCMQERHKSHKTGSVKAVAEELGRRIKATIGELAGTVDKCKKMQQQLDKVIEESKDDVDKTEREINRRADDLKQLVDQIRESLVLELRTEKRCQGKTVRMLREELDGQMMMVESFRKYSEELLSKGTCCDIVRSASDLENRTRELMKLSERMNVDKLQVDVKFSVNTVNITDIKQLFGHLHVTLQHMDVTVQGATTTRTTGQMSESPLPLMTLKGLDGKDNPVCGLAKLNNKLYVVYTCSDTINVYTDQQPFTQLPSIKVDGLKKPADVSACNTDNCLYVADIGSDCVWKVRSGDKVQKWFGKSNVNRLSVTVGGNVVMLVRADVQECADGPTWFGKLFVCNAAGVQLTKIKLPNSITNPHCVVQTTNETFIISYGDTKTKGNSVCEVNKKGKIIATFGGSPGRGQGQLNGPVYVTLDSEERVLVVDYGNQRVVLLNRQLDTQLRVLLSWNTNLRPWRVFYDKDTKQLIIGFYGKSFIVIYSLL